MSGVRPSVYSPDGVMERMIAPGDLVLGGEVASTFNANAGGTWPAAAIVSGILTRGGTGGGAGFTDTTDTSTNILAALAGAGAQPDVQAGSTFRLLLQNTVAQALTFAAGVGVVAGSGTLNILASNAREYLVTIVAPGVQWSGLATFGNASKAITFVLPPNATSLPLAASNGNIGVCTVQPGMTVIDNTTGGNLTAATTVTGLTMGQGGIIGCTINQNTAGASAAAGDSLTFVPTIRFDGLRTAAL